MQEHGTVMNLVHLTPGQTDCNSYPSIGMIPCVCKQVDHVLAMMDPNC